MRLVRWVLAVGMVTTVAGCSSQESARPEASGSPAPSDVVSTEVTHDDAISTAEAPPPTSDTPTSAAPPPATSSPAATLAEGSTTISDPPVVATEPRTTSTAPADQLPELAPVAAPAGPLDAGPDPEQVTKGEFDGVNEVGERVDLDESGALACADVEVGLAWLEEGENDRARGRLTTAGERARASSTASIEAEASAIDDALASGDVSDLWRVLQVCTSLGFEV